MNPKKTKEKERRRARKLAEQAWEAADAQNLDLAEKIIRRAVATQPENPVLWNDQGMLLCLKQMEREAEEAFRTAVSLAPTYAEAYAHLAAIRARHGYLQEAIGLMEKAVKYAPRADLYTEDLEAYRALATHRTQSTARPISPEEATEGVSDADGRAVSSSQVPDPVAEDYARRLALMDWQEIGQQLTHDGCVLLPALVDAGACEYLRNLFDDDTLFAKTVVMERDDFGRGVYRYFRAPLPSLVSVLRRAVYPFAAKIANQWQELLGEPERYPTDWESFREQCRAAGQTTPTPILLKYGPGGFNALHRDLRGTVYFPIQMAVVLSPRADHAGLDSEGFRGGDFLFCDVPEGKKARRRALPAGLGDAVLFCTRDRLVRVGGAYGLQPVKHGVAPITEGTRLVLGVPFHEYR
jgi:hypothetical protein